MVLLIPSLALPLIDHRVGARGDTVVEHVPELCLSVANNAMTAVSAFGGNQQISRTATSG
jgi:hypothetical protein